MAVGYTTRQPQRAAPTDHLSTHEGHDASSLGEPLVPADGHSQLAVLGVPHLEATVAGVEVELLLVAGSVRDVRLAIDSQDRTVSIDDLDVDGKEGGVRRWSCSERSCLSRRS